MTTYNFKKVIHRVLDKHPEEKAIYPIHMNSVVRKAADVEDGDCVSTPCEYSKSLMMIEVPNKSKSGKTGNQKLVVQKRKTVWKPEVSFAFNFLIT